MESNLVPRRDLVYSQAATPVSSYLHTPWNYYDRVATQRKAAFGQDLVASTRIELVSHDYQSRALPLSYEAIKLTGYTLVTFQV